MGTGCNECAMRGMIETKKDGTSAITNSGYSKLPVNDWLVEYEQGLLSNNFVEVQFKNTRKEFYKNTNNIRLKRGDIVAVEAAYGHDIGTITLTGGIVAWQMKKKGGEVKTHEIKTVYRLAKPSDLSIWKEALSLEHPSMLKARQIVSAFALDMKIGDVEYQGDKSKIIFYYTAEGRVDFRQLIKKLSDEFKVRIEMKQIGARQEAGRIGGIGSCGRELCCSSWKSELSSVSINAARIQDLSPNAQKLTGQCGKLKCCLMFELDSYMEARQEFPPSLLQLETIEGVAYPHKTDVLKREIYYSLKENSNENLIAIPVARVKEIINMNKRGEKAKGLFDSIKTNSPDGQIKQHDYVRDEEDINRFDVKKQKKQF